MGENYFSDMYVCFECDLNWQWRKVMREYLLAMTPEYLRLIFLYREFGENLQRNSQFLAV